MRFLTVSYSSVQELEKCIRTSNRGDDEGPTVFCPTKAMAVENEEVVVDLRVPTNRQDTENRRFFPISRRTPAWGAPTLRGKVAEGTPGHGLWIKFEASANETLEHLLNPGGVPKSFARSHRRLPTSIPCQWQIEDDPLEDEPAQSQPATILDLSRGGAFVSGPSPLIGTRVAIKIRNAPFQVDGRVTWTGNNYETQGYGVRFDSLRNVGTRWLRSFLRKASEAGQLPGWMLVGKQERPKTQKGARKRAP